MTIVEKGTAPRRTATKRSGVKGAPPATDDLFRHKTSAGEFVAPSTDQLLTTVKFGVKRRILAAKTDAERTMLILEALPAPALAVLDELDDAEATELLSAWAEWSGASVGESSAS